MMADPPVAGPRLVDLNPARPPTAGALRAREYRKRKRQRDEMAALGVTPGARDVMAVTPDMTPNVTPSVTNVTAAVTNVTRERARRDVVVGVTLIVTAVLLAGIGMLATTNYAVHTATGTDRLLLAALAVAADLLTLMLPTASAAVWRAKRRGLAAAAALLWLASAGVTATNLAGFVSINSDAFLAGRETASTERAMVLERAARLRAARTSISESRPVGAITVAIRSATRAKVDDERAALAIAKHRDQIDEELAAISVTIPTLPAVNAVDPSAAAVSGVIGLVTGTAITEEAITRARLVLLLALPLLGGLVLAIGVALANGEAK